MYRMEDMLKSKQILSNNCILYFPQYNGTIKLYIIKWELLHQAYP